LNSSFVGHVQIKPIASEELLNTFVDQFQVKTQTAFNS